MKAFFYLLCLLNLGFLFWQFHTGKFNPIASKPITQSSILLVSESARAQRGAVISGVIDQPINHLQQQATDRYLDKVHQVEWQMKPLPTPVVVQLEKPQIAKLTEAKSPAEKSPDSKKLALQSSEKSKEIEKPVTPAVQRKCYDIGPFSDQIVVKKWLASNGIISNQIFQTEVATPSDFQVYYPAAKSSEQARNNKLMLIDKGLQDVWLISAGENKGGISLGVFKEKQRATVFKAQLAARGIQAEILQRKRTQTQWFVSVMLDKASLKKLEAAGNAWSVCSVN